MQIRKQQLELDVKQTGSKQVKGERQGCILSPCLCNLYAEYIRRNAEREKAQAGIKIAGRNINNLRYADDTTFTHWSICLSLYQYHIVKITVAL